MLTSCRPNNRNDGVLKANSARFGRQMGPWVRTLPPLVARQLLSRHTFDVYWATNIKLASSHFIGILEQSMAFGWLERIDELTEYVHSAGALRARS